MWTILRVNMQALEQSAKLEDHMPSITKFAERSAIGLSTKTAAKVGARREIIRRLGLRVELGRHARGKYADAVFYLPAITLERDTVRRACQLRV